MENEQKGQTDPSATPAPEPPQGDPSDKPHPLDGFSKEQLKAFEEGAPEAPISETEALWAKIGRVFRPLKDADCPRVIRLPRLAGRFGIQRWMHKPESPTCEMRVFIEDAKSETTLLVSCGEWKDAQANLADQVSDLINDLECLRWRLRNEDFSKGL